MLYEKAKWNRGKFIENTQEEQTHAFDIRWIYPAAADNIVNSVYNCIPPVVGLLLRPSVLRLVHGVMDSIIWCDQRTSRECEEMTQKVGAERMIEITIFFSQPCVDCGIGSGIKPFEFP